MKFRPTLLAFGLGVLATATMASAYAESNVEQGKVLAYTCLGCHGIPNYKNASPSFSVPRLGGQHSKYIANALKEYSSGERSHPTMHAQAASLNDQDRADIAAYLQGQPVQSAAAPVGTPPPATQTCVACHGVDGAKTIMDDYPILAGQKQDYLVHALKDYKSGKRKNPIMAGIITAVEEKDFEVIAAYFARQRGVCGSEVITKHGKCE